jgi:hypothetical protein
MARINTKSGKTTPLLAASLLAALCAAPARAQESSPPAMAFGQEMPQQFLVNRLTNPSRETIEQNARNEARPDYSRAPDKGPGSGPVSGPAPVEVSRAPAPSGAGKATAPAEVAGGQPVDNGNYYDPFPKQFLVNRILGGGSF